MMTILMPVLFFTLAAFLLAYQREVIEAQRKIVERQERGGGRETASYEL